MSHALNIQRTLEAMFKQKTSTSGIFRVSRGMQFERTAAPYLFFGVIGLLTFSIVLMINSSLLLGLLILPLCIPILAYIIDIQGFEVDFKNGKIRKYRSFLGIHSGDWMDLAAFDSVRVYQHQLKTQRGKFIRRGTKAYDTHAYYYVRLVSPGLTQSISLLELDNYNRAKHQAEKVAHAARLIMIDKPAKLKENKV
ncbi:MAG: hypothetical protein Crog4KO_30310 [Crocinitomicaceae bacterium]